MPLGTAVLPIEQEGCRKVQPVKDRQRVIGCMGDQLLGVAEFAGTLVTKAGGPDQVRMSIHQTGRAYLRPGTSTKLGTSTAIGLSILRRIRHIPDHAIDGEAAKTTESGGRHGCVSPMVSEPVKQPS
jgi:hypothetical protein